MDDIGEGPRALSCWRILEAPYLCKIDIIWLNLVIVAFIIINL
jgi:hypothetical protein